MADKPFSPQQLKDGLLTFQDGVDHNRAPELLPRTQLAEGINTSIRGDFVGPRSYLQKRGLNFLNPSVASVLNKAWVQGACYYKPDSGKECLMLSAAGRLYQFEIDGAQANVTDVTGGQPQKAGATQCWLWQAEKWVIWNDGSSNPVFYAKGDPIARSNYNQKLDFSTFNTAPITIPAVGAQVLGIAFNSVANLVVGDIVTLQNRGSFSVQNIVGVNVDLLNINATPAGYNVPISAVANLFWSHFGTQLPPGRMGTYGLGRVWQSLTDGKQFVASDAVGGSSGTQSQNYRNAVLNITENLYLAGGGNFTVPGSIGDITAMRFAATLDASLGQGALQVFTRTHVFSCNAPADRTTWQDITNPILTQSLIAGGATGQDSTQAVNGDTFMRSVIGLTSLILARREFATWGNTPISQEVSPTFALDSQDLLPWGSAINFDNRYLQTVGTVLGPHGPYFQGLVPLNLDPVSGIRGKQPPVYDARTWTGLNIYKVLTGEFSGVDRAFAFCWNSFTDELELYEILPSEIEPPLTAPIADNGTSPVTWLIESGTLDFGQPDPRKRDYKRLGQAEIYVDELRGTVQFMAWWRPDQWPCWVPWAKWEECAQVGTPSAPFLPQFRPRMGLPEPNAAFCDSITNRPLREGYTFRFRLQVTGHCVFKGAKFVSVTAPEPQFAPPVCASICPT